MNDPNPYQAPQAVASEPQPVGMSAADWASLLAIAQSQRFVCWTLLIGIGLTIASFVINNNPVLAIFGFVLMIGAGLLQVVAMFRLASKTYRNAAAGILLAVLAFFPIFGLVALAIVNQKATEKLKAAGVKVGFMGAPQSELDRMAGLATGGHF